MKPKTEKRERPIIFQGWGVRCILDGTKTQSRRVIKPQPEMRHGERGIDLIYKWDNWGDDLSEACPHGLIGQSLWLRETWATIAQYDDKKPSEIPKGTHRWPATYYAAYPKSAAWNSTNRGRVRPSIFMPRWASRINLEIKDVRAERVQDITEEDADAEIFGGGIPHGPYCGGGECHCGDFYIQELFGQWWDIINAEPRPVKRAGEVVAWVSYPWSLKTFLARCSGEAHQFEEGAWSYRPGRLKRPVVEEEFLPLTIHENPWVWVIEFVLEKGGNGNDR